MTTTPWLRDHCGWCGREATSQTHATTELPHQLGTRHTVEFQCRAGHEWTVHYTTTQLQEATT